MRKPAQPAAFAWACSPGVAKTLIAGTVIFRLEHGVPCRLKEVNQELPNYRVILQHQDRAVRHCSPALQG